MSPPIKQNPLWFNFFRPHNDWIEETAQLCQQHQIFKNIPHATIRWFVSTMHPREYRSGEHIFFAGDEGAGAVLLLSGEVEITHNGTHLATIVPGDIFGEVALVNGKERTADATATQPSAAVFFLRTDLDEWIESQPQHACILLKNLGNMLSQRLLEANRALSEIAQ
ncbi:MAG: cyclic nucleotide-binding domain-containing protein [Mariprofundales bacterium]|nr:cyclic nucleotide-binding domain-containing protein [Mariprofundales bacterium]